MELEEAIKVLQKHLREDKLNCYNLWHDQISSRIFDKFRRFGGDKPVYELMETKITLSYKDVLELIQEGTKNFLDNLIKE